MKCICQLKKPDISTRSSYTFDQLEKSIKAIETLDNFSETLHGNLRRIRNEYIQNEHLLQSVLRELPALKESMDHQNAFIAHMNQNEQPLAEDILLSKQRLTDNSLKLMDGTCIWRIENVLQKMR